MKPTLFDTTVWIDFFKGSQSKESKLLADYITNDYPVLLCPIIIQEILQGIRSDKDYEVVKESLFGFDTLDIDPLEVAVGAADLYRSLRKKGVTIRKSNDCQIAYYAITYQIQLVHRDKDFDLIARHERKLIIAD